ELAVRRERIRLALADFDAATIATTHGFCQQMLEGLGTAASRARDAVFAEDVGDLIGEVVDDLYIRRFHAMPGAPFPRKVAHAVGWGAVQNALAPLEPRAAPPDSVPGMRVDLARAVRSEMERRKRRLRIVTYDDFLTLLRATLADPDHGEDACGRIRGRYRVALIDEFQDTDPVQWEIVRRAFSPATLVLIGDPKQAIYAFRGADVHTYLRAAAQATARATLSTNWRSDQELIDAYDALFRRARLGHAEIPYRTVKAAGAVAARRLSGSPDDAPLRVRIVRRAAGLVVLTDKGYAKMDSTRPHIARDLAADVVRLLSSPAEIVDGERPVAVRPGHIAVLVRTNREASLVRDALAEVGVPAVINGAGSVFGTRAADEWLRLLRAIERPSSATLAASAALTVFLGWVPVRLAEVGDADLEELHAQLHRLGGVLRRRGVAALLETVAARTGLAARVLAERGGERTMTDLRHVGQLLHAAASEGQLGVSALAAWLSERIAQAGEDTAHEDRSRRLESDAEAVQVLTIHRSKGLEFPIVYCPFLWDPSYLTRRGEAIPVFHDPDADDERTLDVGGPDDAGFADRYRLNADEQRGEDLRLAYVALTRARHQAVVWWAGSFASRDSSLGRLLFSTDADGNVATAGASTPSDDEVWNAVVALAPSRVSVEWTSEPPGVRWRPPAGAPTALAAARLGRAIDAVWRRSSYSSVIAGTEEERVASEPEVVVEEDPADAETAMAAGGEDPARLRAVALPLADLPSGVELGSVVHSVLERADFAAPDLRDVLISLVAEQAAWRGVEIGSPAAAAAGLLSAIETPLGVGVRLRDLARADRIDEMVFELPLVGGDAPTGTLRPGDIADLLESRLGPGDPLAAYPERLREPGLTPALRGYLNGAIDLVARLPDGRFAVIDYKSNLLGADPPTAFDYRPAALATAMRRAHYPLQALLYLVALHRYLRWRLPGYDPDRHLAGAGYLFLRGMVGPDTPTVGDGRCGVFWWRPPESLVPALSDLLAEGAP
ncbi:MAG: UvrD-helicase domain-containing protein, partial [Thermoleophilia bacterium]